MREQGRAILGFFPTPPSVVRKIANLLDLPQGASILDAGAGEGEALEILNEGKKCVLYGCEVDKSRADKAHEKFEHTGGECIWSAIEDTGVSKPASVLWFNPPYDTVRSYGRMEMILLEKVLKWPVKNGLIVAILPESFVFEDYKFCEEFTRYFNVELVTRFPAEEYKAFKQWVVIGRRREQAMRHTYGNTGWADSPDKHGSLENEVISIPAPLPEERVRMRKIRLGKNIIKQALAKSPARGHLLREAIKPAIKIEQPLLPLKEGHLAMALAGGLCDGIVEQDGTKFLVKGSLSSEVAKVNEKEKTNKDGEVTHQIDVYRTVYRMTVRCLREDGTIENYSSHEDEDILEPEEEKKDKDKKVKAGESKLAGRIAKSLKGARKKW